MSSKRTVCAIVTIVYVLSLLGCSSSNPFTQSYSGKYYPSVCASYLVPTKPPDCKVLGNSSFVKTDYYETFLPTKKDALSAAKKIGATHVRFSVKSKLDKRFSSESLHWSTGSEYYVETPANQSSVFEENQRSYVEYTYKNYWFQAEYYRSDILLFDSDQNQIEPIENVILEQIPEFNYFKFWDSTPRPTPPALDKTI